MGSAEMVLQLSQGPMGESGDRRQAGAWAD